MINFPIKRPRLNIANKQGRTHVLHVVGAMNRGGAETMIMNIFRAIDSERVVFEFLYFTDEICEFDDEIASLGGAIHRLPHARYNSPFQKMKALAQLLRAHPRIKVVHIHTLLSSGFYLISAYLAGVQSRIVHSHNTDCRTGPMLLGAIYRYASRKLISLLATERVACGDSAAEYLFPNCANVLILPNSLDLRKTYEAGSSDRGFLRNLLGITKSHVLMLQVARLMPVKNHRFTVELMSGLKDNGVEAHVVIVGDGPLLEDIKNYASKLNVEDMITFYGVSADVPKLMGGADVLLLPSLFEGFPVVLVESQAVGLPAIVSSKVSQEIDLGVDLVHFAPLESGAKRWIEKLAAVDNLPVLVSEQRLAILKKKGFDVSSSADYLVGIYCSS